MTPQARVQAAIDILDEVITAARGGGAAADTIIARYFKARRYAGSKDRRAVRDHVYAAIRRAGEIPADGRAAMIGVARDRPEIAALFDGSAHGPQPIEPGELSASSGLVPQWLEARLCESVGLDGVAALLDRAPLDLRVNTLRTSRDALLDRLPEALPTPHARNGLRLPEGTNVEALDIWTEGLIEIQDEGSQLLALAVGAGAGQTVVDLCAGAGGKTLALAAEMGGQGRLIACDADRGRLSRLAPRAARAGAATMIEMRLLDGGRELEALGDLVGTADAVLIDAPCSGTGTWRRNPEARWRLTPERLAKTVALQARLIEVGAALVAPGGTLTYAVCSVLDEEGAAQVAAFLDRMDGWSVDRPSLPAGRSRGAGMMLDPAHDETDGFFVARLRRRC
ncbi:RsmB/NOP family class I SAM-dependent RNA methyltransferase [Sphingomonas sp. ID0503]|uniref:RsmB/NOP family class I SAM-dependent RNA methyltransferase n=1 Tax=Sphingomonas sp. ID0503 TaxID=3399691 RepID=UPI003AFB3B3D